MENNRSQQQRPPPLPLPPQFEANQPLIQQQQSQHQDEQEKNLLNNRNESTFSLMSEEIEFHQSSSSNNRQSELLSRENNKENNTVSYPNIRIHDDNRGYHNPNAIEISLSPPTQQTLAAAEAGAVGNSGAIATGGNSSSAYIQSNPTNDLSSRYLRTSAPISPLTVETTFTYTTFDSEAYSKSPSGYDGGSPRSSSDGQGDDPSASFYTGNFHHHNRKKHRRKLTAEQLRRHRSAAATAKKSRNIDERLLISQGYGFTSNAFSINVSTPVKRKMSRDWLFHTMEATLDEVAAAKNSGNWVRKHILKTTMSSYNILRETYRVHAQSRMKPESSSASKRSGFLNYLALLVNYRSLGQYLKSLFTANWMLTTTSFIDVLADIMFCLLYFVEMEININNLNSIDFSPRWLFVARPSTIFIIAVIFSIYNIVVFIFRGIFTTSKIKVLTTLDSFILLITCVPFLILTRVVNGKYIYVPYFLRAYSTVERIKKVVRLRGDFFYIKPVTEKLIVLIVTVLYILYTAMCIFQYVELYFQPPALDGTRTYRVLTLTDVLYYIVITISTVGYGDIAPTSVPGRLLVIILILVSLAVVPGLITSTVDTLNLQKSGGGNYIRGRAPFVVLIGSFDTVNKVVDVLNVFLNEEKREDDLQVVFLSRNDPSSAIKVLITNSFYRSRVVFLKGVALDAQDLKRAQVQYASAVFIVASRNVKDARDEDERNTLRAWACDEYAPLTPLYVYNLLPDTETYQEKTTTATVCVETLQQAVLAYSCLYKGSGTLMVNLLNQSIPYDAYDEPWKAQYGDGSGNELYCSTINPIFVGKSFSEVSWFLYKTFQIILFAIRIYVPERETFHISLNPGLNYILNGRDECIFIAQDLEGIRSISHLTQEAYKNSMDGDRVSVYGKSPSLSRGMTSLFTQSNTPVRPRISEFQGQEILTGFPEPPYSDNKVPLCYLLKKPTVSLREVALRNAQSMKRHILVCTGNFDVFKFVCTLRAAHLTEDELRPILLLCERWPTMEEFEALSPFPSLYYMVGDCRNKRGLIRGGIEGAEKVVIINFSQKFVCKDEMDDEFGDSAAIMVSHLIYNMFHHMEEQKTVLVELQKRDHIKFLRPGAKHWSRNGRKRKMNASGSKPLASAHTSDFLYAPMFAAGRVLVAAMLDTILYQSYFNSSVLDIFQLLCGIRSQKETEVDKLLGIQPSYLCYIDVPEGYVGKTFGELYKDLALIYGVIPIGLYRIGDSHSLMNKLPYVFTNPLPGILLRDTDLVYAINPNF